MDDLELLARLRDDVPELDPAVEARVRARLVAQTQTAPPVLTSVPDLPRPWAGARAGTARGTPAPWSRRAGRTDPGRYRRTMARVGVAAAAAAAVLAGGVVLTTGDGAPIGASPAAAEALDRAATAAIAARPSAKPGPGQVLYVRTTGTQFEAASGKTCSSVHEMWTPADLTKAGQIRRTDGITVTSGTADPTKMPREAGCYQASFTDPAPADPKNEYQDPKYYAALPTEPAALYKEIRNRYQGGSASRDENALVMLTDMARSASPYMPPTLLAAIYRAIALVPGVDVVGNGKDALGRPGMVLGRTEPVRGTRAEFVIDPNTGELLGERDTVVDPTVAEVPKARAGTVLWQSVATTTVVDRVGELPTG